MYSSFKIDNCLNVLVQFLFAEKTDKKVLFINILNKFVSNVVWYLQYVSSQIHLFFGSFNWNWITCLVIKVTPVKFLTAKISIREIIIHLYIHNFTKCYSLFQCKNSLLKIIITSRVKWLRYNDIKILKIK